MGKVELLREQLQVHEQNLARLELQAARHGMDVPLALQNQIDFEKQKIEELRGRLAEAEAEPVAREVQAVPVPPPSEPAVRPARRRGLLRRVLITVVVLVILVLCAYGAFVAYRLFQPPGPVRPIKVTVTPHELPPLTPIDLGRSP
jgi:hypothetical protein